MRARSESAEAARERVRKWNMKQPNVVLASGGRGMGSGVLISVHKSYADFDRFMSEHKRALGDLYSEDDTVLVNLGGTEVVKPLRLNYLADVV
jgi:hypothetical protein